MLWHHPGTLVDGRLDEGGPGFLLAAQSPRRDIVRIDGKGEVIVAWAPGDGPSRLATAAVPGGGVAAVTLRQVLGRGQGVQHALTFFNGAGSAVGETELPPSATPQSYSPIVTMDAGRGAFWLVVFGDGSIQAFSFYGRHLVTQHTGTRLTTYAAVPGRSDLLITAAQRGLIAWRPDAAALGQ